MKKNIAASITLILFAFISTFFAQQPKSEELTKLEQLLKGDAPRILCVSQDLATSAQPKEEAFAKLAANGCRSVLNMRTDAEGAFCLIYRVVEQGWTPDKALEEATQIALTNPAQISSAQDYIAAHKQGNL